MTKYKITQHEAQKYITARRRFAAHALSGETYANAYNTGWLSPEWTQAFHADAARIDYVVYSFYTPIAWHTPDGWTVPRATYSPITSSKHQSKLYPLYSTGEPVRTRVDAKRVTSVNRMNNTVNGNPRAWLTFDDGTRAMTSSDAAVGYDMDNALHDGLPRFVDYTAAGRVASWHKADQWPQYNPVTGANQELAVNA